MSKKINPEINQNHIISRLNSYFAWNHLPARLNTNGICTGVSSVFVKYALQGKLQQFVHLLHEMSTLAANTEHNEEINAFAQDIAASFMPQDRDKRLNQSHAISTLSIDGKPLKLSYDLAMITSEKNWANTLKDIQLHENEAMLVRSFDHTAALIKKNGEYLIYDPNYIRGFKIFNSEEAVVDELNSNVFPFRGSKSSHYLDTEVFDAFLNQKVNLHVQVIQHPSNQNARTFPNISQLYNNYLDSQSKADISIAMHWAIVMDNKDIVDKLYSIGFDNSINAGCVAASNNSTTVLPFLLEKIKNKYDQFPDNIIWAALIHGRQEALDILLKDEKGKARFSEMISSEDNAAIAMAARGGNEDILEYLFGVYRDKELSDEAIAEKILAENAVQAAITSQSVASVNLLYRQLEKAPGKFNEESLLTHLLQAIKSNQPRMVQFFIEATYKLPKDQNVLFEAITLSTRCVETTDIAILQQLRNHGVQFSKSAQAVIARKENRPTGFFMPIGVMLYNFTDYLKEILLNHSEIKESLNQFKKMKSQLDIENTNDSENQLHHPDHRPGVA